MINVGALKEGNIAKILIEDYGMGLAAGDTLIVKKSGYWKGSGFYAACITEKGYTVTITELNYRDYELVC